MSKVPSRTQINDMFDHLDKNKDGSLNRRELVNGLVAQGFDEDTVMKWFVDIDKDGDCVITRDEFVNDVCKTPRCESIAEAFKKADKDGNGLVTYEEIEIMCAEMGMTDKDALKLGFEKMDHDRNGSVDIKEFQKYMNDNY